MPAVSRLGLAGYGVTGGAFDFTKTPIIDIAGPGTGFSTGFSSGFGLPDGIFVRPALGQLTRLGLAGYGVAANENFDGKTIGNVGNTVLGPIVSAGVGTLGNRATGAVQLGPIVSQGAAFTFPINAELVFESHFEPSVELNAPAGVDNDTVWTQAIVGQDLTTPAPLPITRLGLAGYGVRQHGEITTRETIGGSLWPLTFWGSSGTLRLEAGVAITALTVGDYITNVIETLTGFDGNPTNALKQTLLQNGVETQDPYYLAGCVPDSDLYLKYRMKLPANFAAAMGSSAERTLFEWRTPTDAHYAFKIITQEGVPSWAAVLDNQSLGGTFAIINEDNDSSVPVPADTWFQVEIFVHREGNSRGTLWVAIDGVLVSNLIGPNLGANIEKIDRLYLFQLSTTGGYPCSQWIDDVSLTDGLIGALGVGITTLGAIGSAGVGALGALGTGDTQLGEIVSSGSGIFGNSATGTTLLGEIISTGSATPRAVATGAVQFGPIISTAVGVLGVGGAGASLLGAIVSQGLGSPAAGAAGATQLGPIVSLGAATPRVTAAGAVQLDAIGSTGLASPLVVGSGTVTLAGIVGAGLGVPVITGSGKTQLGALSSAGAASTIVTGAGDTTLAPVVSAGQGSPAASAAGASLLGLVRSLGRGGATIAMNAVTPLGPLLSTGRGAPIVAGSAAITLGDIVSDGVILSGERLRTSMTMSASVVTELTITAVVLS